MSKFSRNKHKRGIIKVYKTVARDMANERLKPYGLYKKLQISTVHHLNLLLIWLIKRDQKSKSHNKINYYITIYFVYLFVLFKKTQP